MRGANRLLVVVSFSAFTFAQNTPAPVQAGPSKSTQRTTPASPFFGAGPVPNSGVITGAPYSAEGQSQVVQTLADGTHIAGPVFTWKFFRDSQGRTRVERPVAANNNTANNTAPQTVIEITDPILFQKFTLNPATKRVRNQPMNPLAPEPTTPRPATGHGEQPQPPEDLGTQTFEGVLCEGNRNTVLWPVGSAGNDRPFSVVTETWTAKDLQLVFLHKLDNPRTGVRTQKLINFSRAEPDAALFQVPADYHLGEDDISAPRLISKVEPKYTNKARKAKLSGSVLLSIVVDPNGMPRDIKVVRPLGLGLDEEAIKAVTKWRFKPGQKNGKTVPVQAQVEVTFRLL